jgi:predicted esterase
MKLLKRVFISFIACLLFVTPAFAEIPDDDILDAFDNNNVFYYNPNGNDCNIGSTKLRGDTIAEKIWNFYIDKGYNDAQVAGILGNANAESGLTPTRSVDGSFYGLFQWGYGRRVQLFERMQAEGLGKYLDAEYWGAGAEEKIPADDLDHIIQVELEHSFDENDTKWQTELKTATTPEEAAEIFLVHFERAVANGYTPTTLIEYYTPYIGIPYQGTKQRRDFAKEFYEEYSGRGVSSKSSGAETGKNLTVIGDSITVGAKTAFKEIFPDLSDSDIDGRISRPWSEGIEIAKTMHKNSIVVFALGTNSPNLTSNNIEEAISAIGQDKTIVFVTNFTNNDTYNSNNELFKEYAKNYSNILVADWAEAANKDVSKYLNSDYIHPTAEGSKVFVQTIKDIIDGNVNTDSCTNTVGGEFVNLVKAYAWPEYHNAPFTERMPAYKEAVERSIAEGRYVGGYQGVDCGGFVTTLVQNSGLEPEYNKSAPGPGTVVTQRAWVEAHGWTLLNRDLSTPVDASILQAGDIAYTSGHTYIYVGEIEGFGSTIASASLGERAPMAGLEGIHECNGEVVIWYRNPHIDMQQMTTTSTLATGNTGNTGTMSETHTKGIEAKNYNGWNYYMYSPAQSNGSLLVFLHGSGEVGGNIESLKNDGGFAAHIANGYDFNSYILMPQLSSGSWLDGNNPQKLRELIDKTASEYNIDRSRIHIAGFSMGANQLPDIVEANPGLFASATVMTNAWYGSTEEMKRIPVRIYYGQDDTSNNGGAVPLYNELKNAGGQVEIISYPNQWHANTIGRVIEDTVSNYMDWILSQKRN